MRRPPPAGADSRRQLRESEEGESWDTPWSKVADSSAKFCPTLGGADAGVNGPKPSNPVTPKTPQPQRPRPREKPGGSRSPKLGGTLLRQRAPAEIELHQGGVAAPGTRAHPPAWIPARLGEFPPPAAPAPADPGVVADAEQFAVKPGRRRRGIGGR